jgi:AraC family transcriptional regulator of adaptative response/methylated-DNA-[protein]-cysteine methyltransferase
MEAVWWRKALDRDARYDGSFVFAVATTGIYCVASCPARRPLRRNVKFFRDPAAAEREGFRRCRRCGAARPDPVLLACRFAEAHLDEPLPLARLAREAGWSPSHLQRTFRHRLGVTPRQYLRRLRVERFQDEVRRRPGVSRAIYAAGFGSPSRLYENAGGRLGMTPARYARKGAGMTIAFDLLDTSIGRCLIAATPVGICAVLFGASAERELRARFPNAILRRDPRLLTRARAAIRRILAGRDASLPLDVRATAFQARVWESLRAIPRGETRSYAQIARTLGRPGAARAVARACASNPVALLIPCHRVVGSDGSLSGYRWGKDRKRALLERERKQKGPGASRPPAPDGR